MTTVSLPAVLKMLFSKHARPFMMICFVYLMSLHYTQAEQNLIILKYAYGKLQNRSFIMQNPKSYQLQQRNDYRINNIEHTYTLLRINEAESIKNQHVNSIDLHLSVEQSSRDVLAKVNITNNSQKDYYIPLKMVPTDEKPAEMCSDMFQITTGNIILDYHGYKCRFDADGSKDSWRLIPSKSSYSYTLPLNHFYFFMPGKRHYHISTLEYTIVDSDWFIELERNTLLLSVFNASDSYSCKENTYSLVNPESNCADASKGDSLEVFLEKFSYFGLKPGFDIRSHPVSIEIDGDNLH
ncbi:hypothetical protein [Trabulsiella odontotermitis]|uniref:hypothetical protein n=1 Tax=Trabulsiella odontotermitis TaxID=379893 RepID=UPI000676AB01|nr:hypothetical protein [Trabulsiella odontotermitis]